jgi:formylmethanofuran dehydrogenase subunit B
MMVDPAEETCTALTHTDIACTVCGCVCDDLRATISDNQLSAIHNACRLAEPWFAALSTNPAPQSPAFVHDQPSSHEHAVVRAAEILSQSRAPLIWGLARSSTAGQRAAVQLADQIGATIDTTASVCHGPSIMAIQQVGESTCSLGEVRNRADLVVFWGADPVVSHPRHLERYSLDPIGEFIPHGRSDRTLVVIDSQPTATSALADVFLQVPADRDFELIWTLRQMLKEPAGSHPRGSAELMKLFELLTTCRYGVVFFGLGLAQRGIGHANVETLLRLVAELNAYTRFTARRLRIPGDVSGADSVLCWQTGFPFAVNLSRGYPRYNPGEYTANELLERNEVDACLLVGSEPVADLSEKACDTLRRIPTITLDYPHIKPSFTPTVRFTTAVYGLHRAGTAYRMDEIPIPLRKILSSPLPSDDEVLAAISAQLIR